MKGASATFELDGSTLIKSKLGKAAFFDLHLKKSTVSKFEIRLWLIFTPVKKMLKKFSRHCIQSGERKMKIEPKQFNYALPYEHAVTF